LPLSGELSNMVYAKMEALALTIAIFSLLQLRVDSQSLGSALRESGIVVTDQVDKHFLLEVEAGLGSQLVDRSGDRMEDIMKALRPMFESLDKNEHGKLGHTAVRYALHRLFAARHGWSMKGLDPAGQLYNSSSPVEVLQGKASKHLQEIFEKRLDDQGFGLQELAVFAAVLETLISMEAVGRLEDLSSKLGLAFDAKLGTTEIDDLLDMYMAPYIQGKEIKEFTVEELKQFAKSMPDGYPFWKEVQKYVRNARIEILGTGGKHSLIDISGVLVHIGERFGKWQNSECHVMKKQLIDLETGEKGCVQLSSFYKRTVASGGQDWQFSESMEYLKDNGIIDASDPNNMKVMVANYMYAQGNCIASSHYYSVCCIDECQSLFGHIERQVRGTTASPETLAAVVAALPSDTVPANRSLSSSQFHRLFKIAEKHGGHVPIHGRLFMQWMHMVYPRECAYPHMSGTTKQLAPEAWAEVTLKDATASLDEMSRFVNTPVSANKTETDQGQCGRWVDQEELFVGGQTSRRLSLYELESDMNTWIATSSVFLLCLVAAAALAALKGLKKDVKHKLSAGTQDQPLERRLFLV